MRQWGVNNLPKVVAQQRHGWVSNPRPLDRKSDALPLSRSRHGSKEQRLKIEELLRCPTYNKSDKAWGMAGFRLDRSSTVCTDLIFRLLEKT